MISETSEGPVEHSANWAYEPETEKTFEAFVCDAGGEREGEWFRDHRN